MRKASPSSRASQSSMKLGSTKAAATAPPMASIRRRRFLLTLGAIPGLAVFDAVEQAWGMKLESKKTPMDVVVIDKVEKPSGN